MAQADVLAPEERFAADRKVASDVVDRTAGAVRFSCVFFFYLSLFNLQFISNVAPTNVVLRRQLAPKYVVNESHAHMKRL